MNARALLVAIRREARGGRGRMLFFVACLAIGTAAVTGVAALVDAVDAGIRGRSRELLAADLRVRSRRPPRRVKPLPSTGTMGSTACGANARPMR